MSVIDDKIKNLIVGKIKKLKIIMIICHTKPEKKIAVSLNNVMTECLF